jgi:two-component system KDP operon response regulator KdpE
LRERDKRVPVLFLTAKGEVIDKVVGLKLGADDYVTKPFGMAELEARLRVLLRRSAPSAPAAPTVLHVGPLTCDLVHRSASVDDESLRLTSKEFDLLAFLARHEGKVCTHQMILREVWGATYSTEAHYLRVYAHRLRKKLGAHGDMLVTHSGIGYELVADGEHPSSVST